MHEKITTVINRLVHLLEYLIAGVTLITMVTLFAIEVKDMIMGGISNQSAELYLHNIMFFIIGLEFVKMLINLTPANTLEVLIMAMARQVIIHHESPLNNAICILCIAGLFAMNKFLISKEYRDQRL